MTKRSVDEWIGKTPDSVPPPRVRLRVFEKYQGRCYLSGRKITPADTWELDHIVALCNGGENRESNLAPAITAKHKEKTAKDVAERAKVDRIRKKHLGIKKSSGRKTIQSRGFDKTRRKKMDGTVEVRT